MRILERRVVELKNETVLMKQKSKELLVNRRGKAIEKSKVLIVRDGGGK